ncbi:MAG: YpmA family protein [Clostridiales bacterium]
MSHSEEKTQGLEPIAYKSFDKRDDMYEIVDFLNKNLKDYHLMFGLRNAENEKMTIRIYEV